MKMCPFFDCLTTCHHTLPVTIDEALSQLQGVSSDAGGRSYLPQAKAGLGEGVGASDGEGLRVWGAFRGWEWQREPRPTGLTGNCGQSVSQGTCFAPAQTPPSPCPLRFVIAFA